MGKRPVYDATTRDHAVKLALQVGVGEAAQRTGVKATTIRAWMTRAGVTTLHQETTRAATEARKTSMEERRTILAEQMLLIAEKAAGLELSKMEDAPLFQIVGSRTRAIHDHQLLSGAATQRTETLNKDAAHAIADELEQRRQRTA